MSLFTSASRLASYRGEASEDRALIVHAAPQTLVLALADGVGGRPGGGEAAQLAIETVEIEGAKLAKNGARLWPGFFRALDDALAAHTDAGQTTLIGLTLTSQKLVGASVGDSEAWWITSEGHFDITEAQRRKPHLGTAAAEPVAFALKLTSPGTLLLASDGLFKYTDPLAVTDAVRGAADVEAAADALVALASAPAGRFYDDLALILVRLDTIAPWTSFLHRFKAD
ncbi:MAG: SpoIIE family protein phosphatase [Armatimonadetes bacterium]|nr:SpoIIE family protein phosphatase [Armatimonadota bacterium]